MARGGLLWNERMELVPPVLAVTRKARARDVGEEVTERANTAAEP